MATGGSVEIDSMVVEDAAWLRKKSDYNHINVAELAATIKVFNLTLKWELKEIEIQTVHNWLHSMITNEKRVYKEQQN